MAKIHHPLLLFLFWKEKKRLLKASTQQSKSLLAVSFAIYHEASNLLVAGGVARCIESESKVSK